MPANVQLHSAHVIPTFTNLHDALSIQVFHVGKWHISQQISFYCQVTTAALAPTPSFDYYLLYINSSNKKVNLKVIFFQIQGKKCNFDTDWNLFFDIVIFLRCTNINLILDLKLQYLVIFQSLLFVDLKSLPRQLGDKGVSMVNWSFSKGIAKVWGDTGEARYKWSQMQMQDCPLDAGMPDNLRNLSPTSTVLMQDL